ncbi:MAG TPA: lysophospholipid acyltransferase family protein [Gemmatimonadaceae bacterium]|nr:lysophospholipid acyltransferase family protein [Gemmatimonadaceae bacterium]
MSIAWKVRLGTLVVRLMAWTWRVRRQDDAGWRALRERGAPWIFALWHGDLLPLSWAHRGEGIVVMVSEHRDGAIIAGILDRLGYSTTRGSSTRGGVRALLGLIRALEEGKPGGVTPDGPRGPRHSYQEGILAAAKRANAPIISIGVAVNRAWRLKSWDRFAIPKPFATISLAYSEPMTVSEGDDVARFAGALHDAGARAASVFARV